MKKFEKPLVYFSQQVAISELMYMPFAFDSIQHCFWLTNKNA